MHRLSTTRETMGIHINSSEILHLTCLFRIDLQPTIVLHLNSPKAAEAALLLAYDRCERVEE